LPNLPANPPFDIARRPDQIILQLHFGQSPTTIGAGKSGIESFCVEARGRPEFEDNSAPLIRLSQFCFSC
jgi:hypothetical protein